MRSIEEIARKITDRLEVFRDISESVAEHWESVDSSKSVKECIDDTVDDLARNSDVNDKESLLAAAYALLSSKFKKRPESAG